MLSKTNDTDGLINKVRIKNEYLRTDLSLLRVTTVASVACRDISLDKASDVLLWMEEKSTKNKFQMITKFN